MSIFILYIFHPYGVKAFAKMRDFVNCHSSEGWNPVFEKAERIILKSLKKPLIFLIVPLM